MSHWLWHNTAPNTTSTNFVRELPTNEVELYFYVNKLSRAVLASEDENRAADCYKKLTSSISRSYKILTVRDNTTKNLANDFERTSNIDHDHKTHNLQASHVPIGDRRPAANDLPTIGASEDRLENNERSASDKIACHVNNGEVKCVVSWYAYASEENTIDFAQHLPRHFAVLYSKLHRSRFGQRDLTKSFTGLTLVSAAHYNRASELVKQSRSKK